MIPHTLKIKNFLSYGPEIQTIEFGSYQLICLSGKNGHGKSALLDAMTWAIWGQARKIGSASKADEGLLRIGQTQMIVSLDFSFNDQMYRIRREFLKTQGKPYVSLEFGIIDNELDHVVPLSENTLRKTQEKIEKTIGLDFDSFINSAFLRQGQANEFSKKSPKDRKEILTRILGLNRFDDLRKAALEKVKNATNEQKNLQKLQEHLSLELSTQETITQNIKLCTQHLKKIETQELKLNTTIQQALEQKDRLNKKEQDRSLLQFHHDRISKEEKNFWQKLRSIKQEWNSTKKTILLSGDFSQLQERKTQLQTQLKNEQAKQKQLFSLKEQDIKIHESMNVIQTKIHHDYMQTQKEQEVGIERLTAQYAAAQEQYSLQEKNHHQLEASLQSINKEKELIEQNNKNMSDHDNYEQIKNLYEKRHSYYHRYQTMLTTTRKELDTLKQKQHSLDNENPLCFECGSNLSSDMHHTIKIRDAQQIIFLEHKNNKLERITKTLQAQIEHDKITISSHEQDREKRAALHAKIKEVKKVYSSTQESHMQSRNLLEELTKKIATYQNKIKELQSHISNETIEDKLLSSHNEYQALTKQRTEITEKTTSLHYNTDQHQEIAKQLEMLEKNAHDHVHFTQQTTLQQQRKQQMSEIIDQLKTLKKEKSEVSIKLSLFVDLKKQQTELAQQMKELQEQMIQLNKEKPQRLQEQGRLEQQQDKLKQIEHDHKKNINRLKEYNATIDTYHTLATAFGKDGIQALLIEEAIPEIEQEANSLLSKLTDNQSHIIIKSLRDLKKGGTKETLDITISDPVGIRPYELFSGGEAFRIDFSLRIAISKLLARRAGTSLQTLIIDEGFGSQDEDGLSHIMDTLYKIQDDFKKIIIVSHLPSMKNQFPVHFMIEKNHHGSTINVLHHG